MRQYRERKKPRKAAMTDLESARSGATVVREKKERDKMRKRIERERVKNRKVVRAEKAGTTV